MEYWNSFCTLWNIPTFLPAPSGMEWNRPLVNTPSYASAETYPMTLMLMLPLISFLCCCCVNCLKISAILKRNWRLVDNGWNIKTAEALLVNTPSEALTKTYPILLLLLFPLFPFFCCCCVDCLKISAIQKWNWRWTENGQNIRTSEALIENTPWGDWMSLTLWCCYCWRSLFCAVAAKIIW